MREQKTEAQVKNIPLDHAHPLSPHPHTDINKPPPPTLSHNYL